MEKATAEEQDQVISRIDGVEGEDWVMEQNGWAKRRDERASSGSHHHHHHHHILGSSFSQMNSVYKLLQEMMDGFAFRDAIFLAERMIAEGFLSDEIVHILASSYNYIGNSHYACSILEKYKPSLPKAVILQLRLLFSQKRYPEFELLACGKIGYDPSEDEGKYVRDKFRQFSSFVFSLLGNYQRILGKPNLSDVFYKMSFECNPFMISSFEKLKLSENEVIQVYQSYHRACPSSIATQHNVFEQKPIRTDSSNPIGEKNENKRCFSSSISIFGSHSSSARNGAVTPSSERTVTDPSNLLTSTPLIRGSNTQGSVSTALNIPPVLRAAKANDQFVQMATSSISNSSNIPKLMLDMNPSSISDYQRKPDQLTAANNISSSLQNSQKSNRKLSEVDLLKSRVILSDSSSSINQDISFVTPKLSNLRPSDAQDGPPLQHGGRNISVDARLFKNDSQDETVSNSSVLNAELFCSHYMKSNYDDQQPNLDFSGRMGTYFKENENKSKERNLSTIRRKPGSTSTSRSLTAGVGKDNSWENEDVIEKLLEISHPIGIFLCHLFSHRYNEAENCYKLISSNQRKSLGIMAYQAALHFYQNDFVKSEEIYRGIHETAKYWTLGIDFYSSALWQRGKLKVLEGLVSELTTYCPLCPEAWVLAGNCYSLKNDHQIAITFFKRATWLCSDYTYAYNLLAQEYSDLGREHEAIASYRKALMYDRNNFQSWYGLARVYVQLQKYPFAEECSEYALKLNPQNPIIYSVYSLALKLNNKLPEALKALDSGISVNSKTNIRSLMLKKADLLFESSQFLECQNVLTQLSHTGPPDASVYLLRAKVCRKLGKVIQAERLIAKAINLDNESPTLTHSASSSYGGGLLAKEAKQMLSEMGIFQAGVPMGRLVTDGSI